ncbi:suppressor of glycerol defect [Blastocladiella emersonii ATCC 22665]|nr:suppressor of glycerol defect [Blastocladiella emersonii ATCC 22665]
MPKPMKSAPAAKRKPAAAAAARKPAKAAAKPAAAIAAKGKGEKRPAPDAPAKPAKRARREPTPPLSSSDDEEEPEEEADASSAVDSDDESPTQQEGEPESAPAPANPLAIRLDLADLDPKLVRQMAALANKLSEGNLDAMATELEAMYDTFPRMAVTSALTAQTLASVAEKVHLLDGFVMTYAALLACIGSTMGVEVVASFVQAAVTRWLELLANPATLREACNVLVLIGHMYNFQIISCALVYDMVRRLVDEVSEDRIELVLKLVKLCGLQLRNDDPTALKDIVGLIQSRAAAVLGDAAPFRVKFMLETLGDLAAGKQAHRHAFFSIADHPLARMAANAHRRRPGAVKLEPLRPSLDDIMHAKTRGMWWRIGSAWVGHDSAAIKAAQQKAKVNESALLKLARKHHMNTDVRRAIFVVVMTAEDYMDAYERLCKLGLTEKQEREIVRVLVHCIGQEKAYNPYYAVLAQKLCVTKHAYKITFQFTLWDYLKDTSADAEEEDDAAVPAKYSRRLQHTARLYSHLIRSTALPVAVLRVLDPTRLSPHQRRFLKVFVPLIAAACRGEGADAALPAELLNQQRGLMVGLDADTGRGGGAMRVAKTEAEVVAGILKVVEELDKVMRRFHS